MSYFCIASPWHMVWLMLHEQMNACQDLFSLTFLENLKVPDTSSHSYQLVSKKANKGKHSSHSKQEKEEGPLGGSTPAIAQCAACYLAFGSLDCLVVEGKSIM